MKHLEKKENEVKEEGIIEHRSLTAPASKVTSKTVKMNVMVAVTVGYQAYFVSLCQLEVPTESDAYLLLLFSFYAVTSLVSHAVVRIHFLFL